MIRTLDIHEQNASKSSLSWWFISFILLICGLLFLSEIINGRFWQSDFKVYYMASQAMQTKTQVYGIPFGLDSGFYKYSPFFLLLIAPYTFFSFKTAAILYYFTNTTILLLVFYQINKLLLSSLKLEKFKSYKWIFPVIFILSLNLISRELHLGNTNLLLLLLILLLLNYSNQKRQIIPAILLTLILLIKPFLLVLVLPMLFFKKFRIVLFTAGFGIVQLGIVFMFFGISKAYALHADWVSSITNHAGSFPSNNNVGHYFTLIFRHNPIEQLSMLLFSALIVFYSLFVFYKFRKGKSLQNIETYIFHSLFLVAILPTLLNTDSEHFLWSMPLISIIAYHLFRNFNWRILLVFILTFILYGTNTNDLVGKTIGDFYDIVGVVGLANIIILMWSIVLTRKFRLDSKKNS